MSQEKNSRWVQVLGHLILGLVSVAILAPFALMIVSSFTNDANLISDGYGFFPKRWSLEAYNYLAQEAVTLAQAVAMTIVVTVVGTTVGLALTALLAYPLSRKDLPGAGLLTVLVVITILFNGGLVPTYLLYTQYFGIKNTVWALIIPGLLMNGFGVFLMRTYFVTSVPVSLLEAARIDGASEFLTFRKVVLPLSLPILATVGLMAGIGYWNDWFNGLIYINKPELYTIQLILNRMLMDIQFLSSGQMGSAGGDLVSRLPGTSIRMAVAVVGSLPILVAYPFFQKYFVKGITVGAVKG